MSIKKTEYSLKIGATKSLNKVFITWIVPAGLYLFNNHAEWVPSKYVVSLAPIMAFATYLLHNFVKLKRA